MDQKQWAVSLSRFAELESCYQLEKSNTPKCKSQTNSVCTQSRYRIAPSPGGGKMMMTKYLRKILDQLLNHILDK